MFCKKFTVLVGMLSLLALSGWNKEAAGNPVNRSDAGIDLPLTEFYQSSEKDHFIILFTGDGGWKPLVTEMAHYFNGKNISVVGINSRKYFWEEKKPQQAAHDLSELINLYCSKWHKNQVILVGYSQGADVLPFAVNRLSSEDLSKVNRLVLVAPAQHADFKINLVSYIIGPVGGEPVRPEMEKLHIPFFTICDDNDQALCKIMSDSEDYIKLPGGHQFNHEYARLNKIIGSWLGLEGKNRN